MQALSPFQLLPDHIVQMMVDHLVGSTRLLSSGVTPSSEEHKLLLMPLLWVCQNFRAVASASFYRVNTVCLRGNYYDIQRAEYHWSPRLGKFYRRAHHLAREVNITLDRRVVFYDDVLAPLSKVSFKSCTFLQARKLKFVFYPSRGQHQSEHNSSKVEANIGAFVQWIKQMAPVVREIEVECGENYVDQYPDTEYFKSLLVQLYQLVPRIRLRNHKIPTPVDLLANDISNLVRIDIEFGSIDPIARLARHSASTLQSLVIETCGDGDVRGLIKDADGNYTEYPQLRVLKLKHKSKGYWGGKPSFPGATPFPGLRLLKLDSYPFGDEVVFRGNAATLEYLDFEAGGETIKMFMELGLFTPTSHPKLQYVKFEREGERGLYPFTTDMAYIKFLLDIGPSATVRVLPHMFSESKVSAALSLLGDYPSIQVLHFLSARLSLWDAITIIRSLPSLSDLHCESLALDPLPGEVIEDGLPAHIVSNYLRMGERFRCCHVYCKSGRLLKEVVTCALLLALICPNLDYCDPPVDYFAYFMDHMRRTIDSGLFKDHALRLRRLFFTK
ncbi:hypothetical protein GGH94_004012 [Coemansia aciculifera]|uniref:F-box domain-containing protein n=1 Tax=Coemansia aciculifera TaxID=417176 RepID=A0A9W8IMS0_9FUNG|nr:hypothetical protein GGH94_004012 [Coemansia aciculifera]